MPRGERTPALDRLTDALWRAWTEAGPRSYNHFAERSEEIYGHARRLSSSTTQEILTRHRVKPPPWDWIRRFWTVLRAVAEEQDLDPDRLGTLESVRDLYMAALAAYHQARQSAGLTGTGASSDSPSGAITGYAPQAGSASRQQAQSVPVGADGQHDEVLASLRRSIGIEWWQDHDDVVPAWAGPYLSLEPAARLIHSYETAVVPGLLQTEAYARGVLRVAREILPEAAISRRVQLLMQRQQILTRLNPPRVWAVFDEAALRRDFGDERIMRAQITHLLELSRLPNVTIQVVPSVTRIRVRIGYPITMLRFLVQDFPDVLYLEQLMNASYLHDPDQVNQYSQLLTGLCGEALSPAETADHLSKTLRDT